MLKLSRRGETWHITGSIRGQRYRESTGTGSRSHAESILAKRQSQILDRETFGEARTSVFSEAVIHYVNQGGEARFLKPLILRWGDRRIADITQAEVSSAAHDLYPGRTAAWHVRAVFTPLNAIVRCAHRAGLCELRIFEKPKIKTKPVTFARDDWFEKVLPHCTMRLAGVILFMTFTGARVQEACNVEREDVALGRHQATLRNTKNGSARVVTLPPILLDILAKLLSLPDNGKPVFGFKDRFSVNQAIERACKRAGAKYLSSHKIGRHAFAARLLAQGHSLRVVQEAGGWRVARMVSDHYGHLERSHIESAVSGAGTPLTQAVGGSISGRHPTITKALKRLTK